VRHPPPRHRRKHRHAPRSGLRPASGRPPVGAEEAADDRLAFWARQAEHLHRETHWPTVLDWTNAPFARWFTGGRLNAAYNCVDRHVEAGHGEKVVFHREGEPGDTRTLTCAELRREVRKAANALLSPGLTAGDRVAIQLPMIPEAVFAMPACAQLGLPHSVVFGGFPRTIPQAQELSAVLAAAGTALDAVLEFAAPQEVVMRRLLSRGRPDDTEEVIRHRRQVYRRQTLPLLTHYADIVRTVHAVGPVEDITDRAWPPSRTRRIPRARRAGRHEPGGVFRPHAFRNGPAGSGGVPRRRCRAPASAPR
jgi:hypothetical protein